MAMSEAERSPGGGEIVGIAPALAVDNEAELALAQQASPIDTAQQNWRRGPHASGRTQRSPPSDLRPSLAIEAMNRETTLITNNAATDENSMIGLRG